MKIVLIVISMLVATSTAFADQTLKGLACGRATKGNEIGILYVVSLDASMDSKPNDEVTENIYGSHYKINGVTNLHVGEKYCVLGEISKWEGDRYISNPKVFPQSVNINAIIDSNFGGR